ncbi:hypothetical protein, partial [Escherichia coli]|uniref:hypothetical protein n=1 Tax=Escherichia coli TaxID=562 RepID=UPI00390CD62F
MAVFPLLRNYTIFKTMFVYIEKNTAHPTMAMTTEGVAKEPEELDKPEAKRTKEGNLDQQLQGKKYVKCMVLVMVR